MKSNIQKFEPLVSCIVPIYNAEKYLEQGINSLLNQTYANIEIILVDDQSTDDSWKICLKYKNSFSHIKAVRNNTNSGGPLRGRQKGIDEAEGDWITFMDGDDFVTPTYIENLIQATQNGKYDIGVTGHSRLYKDGKEIDFVWNSYFQTTQERLLSFYEHFLHNNFWTDPTDTVGQNIIRASICKSVDFSQYSSTVYAEDTLMALLFLSESVNGINFIDKHDFIWRQVEGSGSNGGFSDTANKQEFFSACFDIFHRKKIYDKISEKCPLVSIVVPVYNVEDYLEECLNSITRQSYRNIEVLIVNDGSNDNSQAIIDKCKAADSRIKAIRKSNAGLNMARASGSELVRGDYVTYVDSDDILDPNYVRILYELMIKNDVDISICGYEQFIKNPNIKKTQGDYEELCMKNRIDALNYYLLQTQGPPNVQQMTAWGKLYKTKFIRNTDWKLSNYKRHEDNLETLQWYAQADKGISITSRPLYLYRKNPTSITQTVAKNINPDGKELDYFGFLAELHEKTSDFLKHDDLEVAILNYFSHLNRIQMERFYTEGIMTKDEMSAAAVNLEVITDRFNKIITKKNDIILEDKKIINNIYTSESWRLTQPLRTAKKVIRNLKRTKR